MVRSCFSSQGTSIASQVSIRAAPESGLYEGRPTRRTGTDHFSPWPRRAVKLDPKRSSRAGAPAQAPDRPQHFFSALFQRRQFRLGSSKTASGLYGPCLRGVSLIFSREDRLVCPKAKAHRYMLTLTRGSRFDTPSPTLHTYPSLKGPHEKVH